MSGGDTYAFNQALPSFVITPAISDGAGFVADSNALGILFLGPFTFATFEEANGTTNCSTVRGESSGLFLVQRADAERRSRPRKASPRLQGGRAPPRSGTRCP